MARSYANIATAIWRDDEFRALTWTEQHAYMLLTTQPDISAAGVLSLNLTRWASRAKGCTVAALRTAIEGLESHRFVVVDEDTEELLVRSFVRWDNGFSNPKRRPVIRDAAGEIESSALRRALAVELDRVGLPGREWTRGFPDSHADSQSDSHADRASDSHPDSLSAVESPQDHPADNPQVNSLSDSHADTVSPSERVVVTQGPYYGPQPPTRNPHSTTRTPPPSSAGGPRGSDRVEPPPNPEPPGPEAPPVRCPDHIRTLGEVPPCRACADAKQANRQWQTDRAAAESAERSSRAHERAETTRAAIDACDDCDTEGRLPGGKLCHHDPANSDRAKRGAAAVRAQIRAPKGTP